MCERKKRENIKGKEAGERKREERKGRMVSRKKEKD